MSNQEHNSNEKILELITNLESSNNNPDFVKSLAELKSIVSNENTNESELIQVLKFQAERTDAGLARKKEEDTQKRLQMRDLLHKKTTLTNKQKSLISEKSSRESDLVKAKKELKRCPNPRAVQIRYAFVMLFWTLSVVMIIFGLSGNNPQLALVSAYSFVAYMVFVGALARAAKRCWALTLFNLITFGLHGVIFSTIRFIASFSINEMSFKTNVMNIEADIELINKEIVATEEKLDKINTEISILKV